MAEGPSRKRSFPDDDYDSKNAPPQKKIRFPKGKKVKIGDYVVDGEQKEGPIAAQDAHLVAKERRKRRGEMAADLIEEENRGLLPDITKAEVQYKDEETFEDDGIQIEPFNLAQEREEGYFDEAGNYVEYINENEIKDAWLDGIDANKSYASSAIVPPVIEDQAPDLSSDEIGKIKRRIANVLEPEETVLQALRRLKGTSNNRKAKMSAETKQLFDQLTEDAMMLMENGDYNIYDEKKEHFQREAEGYERLAEARRQGISSGLGPRKSDSVNEEDSLLNGENGGSISSVFDLGKGASAINVSASTDNDGDTFDMFGEDDEKPAENPAPGRSDLDPSKSNERQESGDPQDDYVYDDSSGYYYSSRLGYYYDPSSGLYCYAASGQWFSYNEETGSYDEVPAETSTPTKAIIIRLMEAFAEKKTSRDLGYHIAVTTLDKIGEGKVRDRTGDVLFPVEFSCITFKMFKGEILEGVVHKILKHGVFLRCGPMDKIYLSHQKMPDFVYVHGENPYFKGKSSNVGKDVTVRFRVIGEKYVEGEEEFQAVVGLEGNELGPITL